MRILLLGNSGQLGWELQRSLAPLGKLVCLDRQSHPAVDFLRPTDVSDTVRALRPDIIVNAVGHTAVDAAESNVQAAMQVNAYTPRILAGTAARLDTLLVHFSTDYVFDGSGSRPWREDDSPSPLNVYGLSKLKGEEVIRASGCKHLILRTSWLFSARGNNFAKTMLGLGKERDTLQVVNDQFGAPTPAESVADVTAHALLSALSNPGLTGTYHVAATGFTSRYDYARYVFSRARALGLPIRLADNAIEPVPSSVWASAARRPLNSRLDTSKLRTTFGLQIPDWRAGVERMLIELSERDSV